MDIGLEFLAELRADKTAEIAAAAVVLFAVTRVLAVGHRKRLRSALVLFGLYLALVPVAAILRVTGSTLYVETRFAAMVLATWAFVLVMSTVAFVGLPRVRVNVPRLLQDVLVAGSLMIAVFMQGSRAGLNLSGLIATSAVLTAVIGLAFQDTLGNVVGGLALQLDDSVRLDDWIQVGDVVGRVAEIRWRYTAVETRDWETVIIPNSMLVKGQVTVLGRRIGQPVQLRRSVNFNVDFRYPPTLVLRVVTEAFQDTPIARVAAIPAPDCVLTNIEESFARYAVRYWLTDIAVDNATDTVVRTRIYFALRRAEIPLSMPAHAVFLTEDSVERRDLKTQAEIDRRLRALERVELFAGLSPEEQTKLAEHLHYAPFAAGETMTRQGAEAHWLYMVIEGEAGVRVALDGTADREVATLRSGDFFGEMGLLTGQKRSATVVAKTSVECYRLEKTGFQEFVANRPELAEQIAEILARRQTELSAARDDLDQATAGERMRITRTDLLGKIRDFFGLEGDSRPPPPPSRLR
jgi:small-conductance mechanosensitive channel/CRP-like cAMP-binding protein